MTPEIETNEDFASRLYLIDVDANKIMFLCSFPVMFIDDLIYKVECIAREQNVDMIFTNDEKMSFFDGKYYVDDIKNRLKRENAFLKRENAFLRRKNENLLKKNKCGWTSKFEKLNEKLCKNEELIEHLKHIIEKKCHRNKELEEKNQRLTIENQRLTIENQRLTIENENLKTLSEAKNEERIALINDNKVWQDSNGELCSRLRDVVIQRNELLELFNKLRRFFLEKDLTSEIPISDPDEITNGIMKFIDKKKSVKDIKFKINVDSHQLDKMLDELENMSHIPAKIETDKHYKKWGIPCDKCKHMFKGYYKENEIYECPNCGQRFQIVGGCVYWERKTEGHIWYQKD